jgi:uncharacterized protein (DUF2345 family)
MRDAGTPVVLHGDKVRCPCGKNRVIAGADAKCFYHKESEAKHGAAVAASSRAFDAIAFYDEKFTLLDEAYRPLVNIRYRIITDRVRVITGTTDSIGATDRIEKDGTERLKIYTTGGVANE